MAFHILKMPSFPFAIIERKDSRSGWLGTFLRDRDRDRAR